MTSYTVIWNDAATAGVGRLELEPDGITFHGSGLEETVLFAEIEGVRVGRSDAERLAGRPSLVLDRRNAGPVRIGSLDGLGALNELASTLAA
ncbi:MAG TPA: hypothetical protein VFL60_07890 [Gaiellaceae bacterium]|nr:hypothetical protein [Gaiellaceae bacterium]